MKNLIELEHVLDALDSLADTFFAIDFANQNRSFVLPEFALTIPAETMKMYTEKAKEIYVAMLKERG